MSLLLTSVPLELGELLIERLIAQGDEVRVIDSDSERSRVWRGLGAFVAPGSATDVDLIERAAQNVRSIVVVGSDEGTLGEAVAAAVEGAALAGVTRVIVCAATIDQSARTVLRESATEYVVLATGWQRRFFRRSADLPVSALAEAIDAADDLPEPGRLELDLRDPVAWSVLGLDAPKVGR